MLPSIVVTPPTGTPAARSPRQGPVTDNEESSEVDSLLEWMHDEAFLTLDDTVAMLDKPSPNYDHGHLVPPREGKGKAKMNPGTTTLSRGDMARQNTARWKLGKRRAALPSDLTDVPEGHAVHHASSAKSKHFATVCLQKQRAQPSYLLPVILKHYDAAHFTACRAAKASPIAESEPNNVYECIRPYTSYETLHSSLKHAAVQMVFSSETLEPSDISGIILLDLPARTCPVTSSNWESQVRSKCGIEGARFRFEFYIISESATKAILSRGKQRIKKENFRQRVKAALKRRKDSALEKLTRLALCSTFDDRVEDMELGSLQRTRELYGNERRSELSNEVPATISLAARTMAASGGVFMP